MKNTNPPKSIVLAGIAMLLAFLASVILAKYDAPAGLQQTAVAGVFLMSFGGLYAYAQRRYARNLATVRVNEKRTMKR